jgi:PqqD family protein of HPr-rel-A system
MSIDSKIQSPGSDGEACIESNEIKLSSAQDFAVSERRRRLAKLGFGAPVLMTLASRPVLAGQCLSNMMSGNLSNPTRGNCAKGSSPGGWGQLGGLVQGYSTAGAWTAIGLNFSTSKMSDVPAVLNKDSVPANRLLKDLLTVIPATAQLTRHFVCAYFNAKLSGLSGSTFMYILTTQQVLDLASGAILIPNGAPGYPGDMNTFLDSTWV